MVDAATVPQQQVEFVGGMSAVTYRQVGGDWAYVRDLFQGELLEMFVV